MCNLCVSFFVINRFVDRGKVCSAMNFASVLKQVWTKLHSIAGHLKTTISRMEIRKVLVKKPRILKKKNQVYYWFLLAILIDFCRHRHTCCEY